MSTKLSLKTARSHHPREFADFRFVYPVIARRSGGISIGINLSPERKCNFSCIYCQVNRTERPSGTGIRVTAVIREVEKMLANFNKKGICNLESFSDIPDSRKVLNDIALSGDGEPTLFSGFSGLCKELHELQMRNPQKFKLVLITNGTLLVRKRILQGLEYLLKSDGEIWAKLDAGSEEWHKLVNDSQISLDQLVKNFILAGQHFPLKIQSLFCKIKGKEPSLQEIVLYVERLQTLLRAGVHIPEVQLSTVVRKPSQIWCTTVSKDLLLEIRNKIVKETGLNVHIY